MKSYVTSSLELHLFFARIMKEHAFFMEVSFTKCGAGLMEKAKHIKEDFEDFLCQVIECSKGNVRKEVFESGELITQFTEMAEWKTCQLSCAALNKSLTMKEGDLWDACMSEPKIANRAMINTVNQINARAICLLEKIIAFKKEVLEKVSVCEIYTTNYPALLEHIVTEAEDYMKAIMDLECDCGRMVTKVEIAEKWNHLMKDHALTIRGLLDPSEEDLFSEADMFGKDYEKLIQKAQMLNQKMTGTYLSESMSETMAFREFKAAAIQGILSCDIKALILPLLADHVLREASHYLRLLME